MDLKRRAAGVMLAGILAVAGPSSAEGVSCADLDFSGTVAASDALLALRGAVGLDVDLFCSVPSTPPKTGQTTCSNAAGTTISCTGTGQDGHLKLGVTRSFVDNGDGTITDEATGLMWEKLSNDGTNHDFDLAYTWTQAFALKVAQLNAFSFAGHTDWRVPNRFEMDTLRDLGASNPATHSVFRTACPPGCTVFTCSCTPSECFWTSTSDHDPPSYAWLVNMDYGYSDSSDKIGSTCRVRGVRGGS